VYFTNDYTKKVDIVLKGYDVKNRPSFECKHSHIKSLDSL